MRRSRSSTVARSGPRLEPVDQRSLGLAFVVQHHEPRVLQGLVLAVAALLQQQLALALAGLEAVAVAVGQSLEQWPLWVLGAESRCSPLCQCKSHAVE